MSVKFQGFGCPYICLFNLNWINIRLILLSFALDAFVFCECRPHSRVRRTVPGYQAVGVRGVRWSLFPCGHAYEIREGERKETEKPQRDFTTREQRLYLQRL